MISFSTHQATSSSYHAPAETSEKAGTDAARVGPLEISRRRGMALEDSTDTISSADSILFINNGLIEAPDTTVIKPIAE